jgi:glycerol-3-phosphate dehydrogenase
MPQISKEALTIEAGSGHLFALPWRGHTLLATTDTEFSGDPAGVAVSESDIEGFLAIFRKYLPSAPLGREQVEFFYAGLRPLVSDGSKDSYNVSRRAELVNHGAEGGPDGLFSALGGKYTTSRGLAETVTDTLVKKLGKKAAPCTTMTTPLPGGRFERFEDMVKGFQKTWPGISSLRNMAHMLGARLPEALKGARLTDLVPLGPSGDTPAQVRFALEQEMVVTLEDMVMRRTSLGQFGKPNPAALEKVAEMMAAHLDWTAEKKSAEIAGLDRLYRATP